MYITHVCGCISYGKDSPTFAAVDSLGAVLPVMVVVAVVVVVKGVVHHGHFLGGVRSKIDHHRKV